MSVVKELALVEEGTQLERLMMLDQTMQPGDWDLVLETTRNLWGQASQRGDFYTVARMALIYSFRHTIMPGGKAKFQCVQITDAGPALSWEEFCFAHLEMSRSTASNYLNNWAIYSVEIGYRLPDLVRAGPQRLNIARTTMKRMYPDVPAELVNGIFGCPDLCDNCGQDVGSSGVDPELCPHCGEIFKPLGPLTVAELQNLLEQYKDEKKKKDAFLIMADLEVGLEMVRVIPFQVIGDQRLPLPAWEIPIARKGEVIPEGAISSDDVSALTKFLRKKFKR